MCVEATPQSLSDAHCIAYGISDRERCLCVWKLNRRNCLRQIGCFYPVRYGMHIQYVSHRDMHTVYCAVCELWSGDGMARLLTGWRAITPGAAEEPPSRRDSAPPPVRHAIYSGYLRSLCGYNSVSFYSGVLTRYVSLELRNVSFELRNVSFLQRGAGSHQQLHRVKKSDVFHPRDLFHRAQAYPSL